MRKRIQDSPAKTRKEFSKANVSAYAYAVKYWPHLLDEKFGKRIRWTEEEALRLFRDECFSNIKMFRNRYPGANNFLRYLKKKGALAISSGGIWATPESTKTLPKRCEKTTSEE